ncbi:MAG: 50S ribosomal protein L20, partial [Anaerolineales bacterium]|nr:50S ribosomal protein L20 [Anaerolineales bacterium]
KEADIKLNRKMLADLAVRDPDAFSEIVDHAKEAIG